MMFRVPLARRRRAVGLLALLLALAVVGGAARGSIADPTPSPSTSRSVQVPYYDNALSRKAFEYRDRHLLYDAAANVAVAVVDITGLEFDPSDVPVESPVDTEILEGDDVTFMKYLHPELYDAIKPGKDVRKLLIVTTANVPRKRPPAKAGKKKDKKGTAGEEEDPGIHSEELILDFLKKKKIDANRMLKLYSERQPCPGRCQLIIPDTAEITHTVPYESSIDPLGRDRNEQSRFELEKEVRQAREKKAAEQEAERRAAAAPAPPADAPLSGPAPTAVAAPDGEVQGVRANTGALPQQLAQPVSGAPGGIDFSTIELRYVADLQSSEARGVRYAFQAQPAKGNQPAGAALPMVQEASDAFFVWLELPTWKFTVNLNPTEPDRIVDSDLGKTDAGRILLEADLQLKKTVARLIHPDTSLGAQFWNALDKGSGKFCASFRQWIVPAPATVAEGPGEFYILDAPLTVKMESDYLETRGLGGNLSNCPRQDQAAEAHNEQLFRTMIMPLVERAVNEAPEYESLRRVYYSRVAAEWYRKRHRQETTTFDRFIDQGDVSAWPARQPWSPTEVFNRYVQSFTNGEFNVRRQTQTSNEILTSTYIFGGVDFTEVPEVSVSEVDFQSKWPNLRQVVESSVSAPAPDAGNRGVWLGGMSFAPILQASSSASSGPGIRTYSPSPSPSDVAASASPGSQNGAVHYLVGILFGMMLLAGVGLALSRRSRRGGARGGRNRLP